MAWQKTVAQTVAVTFYSGGVPTAPTGALTATISKDGAGFGAIGGSAVQVAGTPCALLTLNTADTNCDAGVVKIVDAGGSVDDRYIEFATEATYTAAVAAHLDADVSSRAATGEAAAAVATLNDFDPATDTVAHVTLVDTTTTNTDMLTTAVIAAAVWAYTTRTLTSFGTLGATTAAAVWNYLVTAATTVGSMGELVATCLNTFVASVPTSGGADTIREDFANLPFRHDIDVEQSRTWEESYRISISIDGAAAEYIDFTEATLGQIRFKASDGTVTAAITLTELGTGGAVTARLSAVETAALEAGRQKWEMYFKFPVGSSQFPDGDEFALLAGTAVVTESIPAS